MEKIKQYRRGLEMWTRKYQEQKLEAEGYYPVKEEETTERKSDLFLFVVFAVIGLLIFPPLAFIAIVFLFSKVQTIKVTYVKRELPTIVNKDI